MFVISIRLRLFREFEMNHEVFARTLFDSPDEMLPKGTDPQIAVNILADHFLGHDNTIICRYPATNAQWNSEVVYEILRKYPSGRIRRVPKYHKSFHHASASNLIEQVIDCMLSFPGNYFKDRFDSSIAVITAWEMCGVPVRSMGATYTGNMRSAFLLSGFKDVIEDVNISTAEGIKRGDVLLSSEGQTFTAIYLGDNKMITVGINEYASTDYQLIVRPYYNPIWNSILRYTNKE